MIRLGLLVLFFGSACLLTGCGPTKRDVIASYQPQGTQMRTRLAKLADQLPPAGSVQVATKSAPLTPAPAYNEELREGNVECLMESQLRDPDTPPEFDLGLSLNLATCLAWTGPKNPMVESALSSAAGTIDHDFQRGFGFDYLVVIRVNRFEPPAAVDEQTFRGGELELEVFLFRASDQTLLGSFSVQAQPTDNVMVSVKQGDDRAERVRAFVRSSAWKDARRQVIDGLKQIGSGSYSLRP